MSAMSLLTPAPPNSMLLRMAAGVFLAFVNKRPKRLKSRTPNKATLNLGARGVPCTCGLCFAVWAFF